MGNFSEIFNELISSLSRFPGVGRRSAERMAFFLLKMKPKDAQDIASKINDLHNNIKSCQVCNNFSTQDVCAICSNPNRNKDIICIVEEPKDVFAIEKTSQYNGLYYVLLGSLSPFDDVGAGDLNIGKLLNRILKGDIKEVIIATDSDNDGELTAQYLIKKISNYKVKIYRISIGIPLGTQIEYIDSATLGKALAECRPILE
ncbi:MAG: recombination mediator RecR [Candidatus Omnitrophota bacterium]|nr:recombination mediator RecR [Candidatus Omnitrophota bacterium]